MLKAMAAAYLLAQPAAGAGGPQIVLAGMARAQFAVGITILPHGLGGFAGAANRPLASSPAPGANRAATPRAVRGGSTLYISYE